jgi:hypothetical protein
MKMLLRWSVWMVATAGVCFAQAPAFYGKIARLTWVVRSLDKPLQGWSRLGLANVQGPAEVRFSGEYRGHSSAGGARVASGVLGGMAVDFVEPGAGDNAFNDFLARRGDGVFAIVHEAPSAEAVTSEIA